VVVFHGGVAFLPGGFLGVDAFFVLSGFLITSLLLAEQFQRGRIGLAAFWGRRARRLLPALLVVLIVVVVVSRYVLPPVEVSLLRWDALAAIGYLANWRMIYRGSDYFAQTAAPSPLQHTWSLGIEEQFYLLWPLIVVAVLYWLGARRARDALMVICLAGTVASAAAGWLFYRPGDVNRAYFGTDTRAQALLIGCAFAVYLTRTGRRVSTAGRHPLLGTLALLGALGTGWLWTHAQGTDGWLYHGGLTAAALAIAAIVGHAVISPGSPTARLLGLPPLVWLGRISYGVYLWHWPVYLVLDPVRTGRSGWALTGARAGATLLVALASYAIVERPILRGALRGRKWAVIAPAVTAALVAAIAAATGGARSASPSGPPRIAGAPNAANGGGASLRVLILGDSVGVSLSPGLARAGPDHGLAFTLGVKVGCEPGDAKPDCPPPWPAQVARERPDIVLVTETGGWTLYPLRIDARVAAIGSPGWDEAWIQERQAIADGLFAAGAKQIVYTTLACFEPAWWQHEPRLSPANLARANADLAILAARNSGRVSLIDLAGYVCPDNRYRRDRGAVAVVRVDGIHYSADGADLVGRWLAQEIARAARAGR